MAESVFIGWDRRQVEAYNVCKFSLERRSSVPLQITPLMIQAQRHQRNFWRRQRVIDHKRLDLEDNKPFSTDFAFTRFLVPHLMDFRGWALFCDNDFLFLSDVENLFDLRDDRYAVQCVKHSYAPTETVKMDNQVQSVYPRKNWSSLVLWNCAHPANKGITPVEVNTKPGSWLHGFEWLQDDEIGGLPESWNWLEGHSDMGMEANAVHFTRGGPWVQAWEDCDHAEDWIKERALLEQGNRNRRVA